MSAVLTHQVAYENRCEAERDAEDARNEQLQARLDAIVTDKLADYEWLCDAIGEEINYSHARAPFGARQLPIPAMTKGKPLLDLFIAGDAIAFREQLHRLLTISATHEAREELRRGLA